MRRTAPRSIVISERISKDIERVGQRGDDIGGHEAALGAEPGRFAHAVAPAAAARRASMPLARKAAIVPVRTSPVPAVASVAGPEPQTSTPSPGAATSVSAPLRRQTRPNCSTARPTASSRCASTQSLDAEQSGELAGVGREHRRCATLERLEPVEAVGVDDRGHSVPISSRRTSSRRASSLPSPGPIATAPAFFTASKTSSSGRLTASRSVVSSTGSDSAGAATASSPRPRGTRLPPPAALPR